MQSNPRLLVNLLVMSVETPANLLVKLTKVRGGAMGPGSGEYTWERLVRL